MFLRNASSCKATRRNIAEDGILHIKFPLPGTANLNVVIYESGLFKLFIYLYVVCLTTMSVAQDDVTSEVMITELRIWKGIEMKML
jgi:hypothetical protein